MKFETPEFYINNAGTRLWFLPSKGINYIHRLDGPAVEHMNSTKEWWVDGKRHRIGRPAILYRDGTKEWWVDGKRHRLSGPAINSGWTRQWYIDGILLPTSTVEKWIEENEIDLTSEEGMLALKITFAGG